MTTQVEPADLLLLMEKQLAPEEIQKFKEAYATALLETVETVIAHRSDRELALLEENRKLYIQLGKKLDKANKFKNTTFFHVPECGTIAMLQTKATVYVGLALLALDKYFDPEGDQIPGSMLLSAHSEGELCHFERGDLPNKKLGRTISHGRALAQRGYSGAFTEGELEELMDQLKQEIGEMVSLGETAEALFDQMDAIDVPYTQDYVAWNQSRYNVQAMMKGLLVGG